ncbi:MAG: hypothetical protein JXA57_20650 [Armatimonadetes bacterium]|nr:hypothetical protein [Armatimonadota bacterium]
MAPLMNPFSNLLTAPIRRIPFCPAFDRLYALAWFCHRHRRLPRHFLYNERLFWMRWRGELLDPLRQFTTDKVLAKEFIRARVGEEYVVPTLAVLETEEQIRDYVFPRHCVIKPAHGCGAVLFCRDGVVDRDLLISWLGMDHYRGTREQNYVFLRPRVLVEEFALGPGTAVDDVKLFCAEGVPRVIWVTHDREHQHDAPTGRFYDREWVSRPIWTRTYLPGPESPRPAALEAMLAVAAELSRDFAFVRIDLYSDGARVRVGEITHCPVGGGFRFEPENGETLFSELLFGDTASPAAADRPRPDGGNA